MRGFSKAILTKALLGTMLMATTVSAQDADWPMFGQNVTNTANGGFVLPIFKTDASKLRLKWTATTGGDVSARAAVVDGVAYFPDWGGNLWALNAATGKALWKHQFSDYGLPTGTQSRTSPAVAYGTVYVGVQTAGWLLAIDARTGNLKWKTQLETVDPLAAVTTSPTVVDGMVYEGLTSLQEFAAANPAFPCCSSRGSVVAIDAFHGTMKWKTYTVPTGYFGGGVWGSSPVVDPFLHLMFIGTGNNVSPPTDPTYLACVKSGKTAAVCQSPDNHVDSILALDIDTGEIKWSQQMTQTSGGTDVWNVACSIAPYTNCPKPAGPDSDFGSAPNEITYLSNGRLKTILGAGQKSGIYSAFDPATGKLLWQTQVGPASALGGIEWGSASDGERIYVAIGNLYGIPYAGGAAGSWGALDPATGKILWQTADPNGSIDLGPLAVANGVVYAPSMAGAATASTMFALNAATGKIEWSFAAGSSVNAGATVVGNSVFWGSGYAHLGIPGFTGNTKFYMFSAQ